MENYHINNECRICKSEDLELVLDLGIQPPANAFIKEQDLEKNEDKFPLRLFFCKNCYLVQLLDIVDKEYLFKKYLYLTGSSKPIVSHFRNYAMDIFNNFLQNSKDCFVIEIGSNDGSLLNEFKKLGTEVLGIEPAQNIAKIANDDGIQTINNFLNVEIAEKISSEKKASVIVANNVLGHVEDLKEFVKCVKMLLDNEGIFVFEVPYLIDLIQNLEFDTIYHEHLSYFSLKPLIRLMSEFGLEIFNIEKQSVHGGTVRIFVSNKDIFTVNESVKKFIQLETDLQLNKIEIYEKFSYEVKELKIKILNLLNNLKENHKSLFGYGASAKGNVLLNYCNIDHTILDFIIDTTPIKQNKFSPGTHIPILSPEKINDKGDGDVALLLAWNYEEQILDKEHNFRSRGGNFLIPIPKPILK